MDIGFQLSFLAVGGILLFFPPMHRTLRTGYRIPDAIISLILISICAQFSTLPLSVYYFHQLSHYFVLTNLLITPLITVLIYAAPLFFFSGILPFIEQPLQLAVDKLAKLLLNAVDLINELPASYSDGYFPGPLAVIILYVLILTSFSMITFRKKGLLIWVLLSVFSLLVLNLGQLGISGRESKLMVFHTPGSTTVNILSGKDNLLIAEPDLQMSYDWQSMMEFWQKEKVNEPLWVKDGDPGQITTESVFIKHFGLEGNSIWFIQLENNRIGIFESLEMIDDVKGLCLPELDYMLVANNSIRDIRQYRFLSANTTIILDGSNSYSYIRRVSKECSYLSIPLHITAWQGYFRLDAASTWRLKTYR